MTNCVIDALNERFDRFEHWGEVVTVSAGVVESSFIHLTMNQNVTRESKLDVRGPWHRGSGRIDSGDLFRYDRGGWHLGWRQFNQFRRCRSTQ